jgi:spore germination protein YaaH
MKSAKRWIKLVVALAAIGTIWQVSPAKNNEVLAESNAAQGTFNMSYLFFGGPSTYTSQVNKTGETMNVVAPSYFHINEDGSLDVTDLQAAFITEMHEQGKKVVPFLSNDFDQALGEKAIDQRDAIIEQLVTSIKANDLDGIQLDIENVGASYRDKYTDLVTKLREQLPSPLEVSVAVAANPTGATTNWIGLYDYKALAAVSDYLMVMTYDESYPGDPTPSPVASLPFVEKSIQYALTQAPASKIVLGIPLYGRYWNQDPASNGAGIPNKSVAKLVAQYGGTVRYDAASQSPVASFTIGATDPKASVNGKELTAGSYTVWYDNEQSLKVKLALVGKYHLKGTGSWSLNQEADDTWSYFKLWADGFYFSDVQKHWAQADVLNVANRGWMLGTAEGVFAPDAALTRAEAATIIVRALGIESVAASGSATFKDVPATHWASQNIAIAQQNGLMQGISNDRFAPDQSMTREQMSMLLSRALKLSTPASGAAMKFTDVPADSWSAGAIAAMSSNSLVDGFAGGTFRPSASLTRGEMAALLSRAQPLLTK